MEAQAGFVLSKPQITLHASGSEIVIQKPQFGKHTFQRMLDVVRDLSHRRYDKSKKRWYIWPASYQQLLGGLAAEGFEVHIDPSVSRLMELYEANISARLALKDLSEVDFPLGDYFTGELKPFQGVGANYMYRSRRAILGDPVGVGKTPMAIAASLMALKQNKVDFVVCVVPAHIRRKWTNREIPKFTTLGAVDVKRVKKRGETYRYLFTTEQRNIFYIVISYAMLVRDVDMLLSLAKKHNIRFCTILDEIQKCKYTGSARSKAAAKLADYSNHFYGLSATYIEGRLEELYSVFRVVHPEVLGTWAHFSHNYIVEDFFGYGGAKREYKNLTHVREVVAPYVLRRLVEDIGVEMPEEVYQDYWISLSGPQRDLYRGIVEEELERMNAESNPLTRMIKERECCLSTELINPELREAPKIDLLKEIVESIEPTEKGVVFCYFADTVPMVDIIERELIDFSPKATSPYSVLKIKGGMSDDRRENILKQFDEDPFARFLVASDVIREGEDLVAARHLINFDLLWNPAHMRQRVGRVCRMIQEASHIVVHTLITYNTVEEYMYEVTYDKGRVMREVQDGGREEARVTRKVAIEILEQYRG